MSFKTVIPVYAGVYTQSLCYSARQRCSVSFKSLGSLVSINMGETHDMQDGQCECGQEFRYWDEWDGDIRCPGCGEFVRICGEDTSRMEAAG